MNARHFFQRLSPRHGLLVAAGLFFTVFAVRYRAYLIDDAYISLRYSLNLVEGQGLVFNPGERVEGYTNFLWVLLGSLFLALGIDAMTALKAVSLVAAVGLVVATFRFEKTVGTGPMPALFWLLLLEGFAYWVTTGMETTLFAALFGVGLALAFAEGRDGRFRGAALVFLAAALTRPEGVLAFGLGTLAAAALARIERGIWAWREVLRDAAVFGVPGTVYFVGRWLYFGELLPNTFHAKVTGGAEQWRNGFRNLGQWALHHPLFALALLVPAAFLLAANRRRHLRERPGLVVLWLVTLAWIGYVVSVGGDFMPFWRFFVPVLAPCALLVGGCWALLKTAAPWRPWNKILITLAIVQLFANLSSTEPYRAFVAHQTTVVGETVGEYFSQLYGEKNGAETGTEEADAWLAVNTAGSLPYASRLPTIDMLGLADYAIARHPVYVVSLSWAGHRRGWGDYVLSRQPRAVVWYNSAGLAEPHYLGDHQLADNPFFRFFYQMRRQELAVEEEQGEEEQGEEEQREGGSVLTRFLGNPFEISARGGRMAELGLELELVNGPVPYTVVRSAPVTLHYFEYRSDRDVFWERAALRPESRAELSTFLDNVTKTWQQEAAQRGPGDPAARQAVEALCQQAADLVQRGKVEAAKALLSRAVAQNGAARSPLVFQYITNVAVLERSLFLAIHAQQEALRLAPDNPLYRRNLENLLRTPFKDFRERAGS